MRLERDPDERLLAEKRAREDLLSGARRFVFRDGYAEYMAATRMKDRGRDAYEHVWKRIEPALGHLLLVCTATDHAFSPKLTTPAIRGGLERSGATRVRN
jgi:hypothetical protein